MDQAARDAALMGRALELARRAWGETHPNPLVGAVLADAEGRILAEGWHERAGGPHAEVRALRAWGGPAPAGASLYVTLEPCSTHGRTPPCTGAITAAGVGRVVVGATDPNPVHAGRGLEILRAAGVEVVAGVRAAECAALNPIFNHWIVWQSPFVALKVAATLDGRVATRTGAARWITGEAARADVHRWRRYFPAIAVGAGTLRADNPRLTARRPEAPEWCPRRMVLGRHFRRPDGSLPAVFTDEFAARTTAVVAEGFPAAEADALSAAGASVWEVPAGAGGHPCARAWLARCAAEGVTGVYVEGGPALASALLADGLAHHLFWYGAPLLFADAQARPALTGLAPAEPAAALRLRDAACEPFPDGGFLLRANL